MFIWRPLKEFQSVDASRQSGWPFQAYSSLNRSRMGRVVKMGLTWDLPPVKSKVASPLSPFGGYDSSLSHLTKTPRRPACSCSPVTPSWAQVAKILRMIDIDFIRLRPPPPALAQLACPVQIPFILHLCPFMFLSFCSRVFEFSFHFALISHHFPLNLLLSC